MLPSTATSFLSVSCNRGTLGLDFMCKISYDFRFSVSFYRKGSKVPAQVNRSGMEIGGGRVGESCVVSGPVTQAILQLLPVKPPD